MFWKVNLQLVDITCKEYVQYLTHVYVTSVYMYLCAAQNLIVIILFSEMIPVDIIYLTHFHFHHLL